MNCLKKDFLVGRNYFLLIGKTPTEPGSAWAAICHDWAEAEKTGQQPKPHRKAMGQVYFQRKTEYTKLMTAIIANNTSMVGRDHKDGRVGQSGQPKIKCRENTFDLNR